MAHQLSRGRRLMGEIRTVTTLIAKRDEIERPIAGYESRLARAKADLSHVNAVSIFEAAGDRDTTTAYTDIHRLFHRGELTAICKAALAEYGPTIVWDYQGDKRDERARRLA